MRTIKPSPFSNEKGQIFPFGDFAADYAYVSDSTWIYKGTLRST